MTENNTSFPQLPFPPPPPHKIIETLIIAYNREVAIQEKEAAKKRADEEERKKKMSVKRMKRQYSREETKGVSETMVLKSYLEI